MNIFANHTLTKVINNRNIRNFVSQMSNHKALLPIIMLESSVITGRSINAYKRGGMTECRERMIDETITAVVWFGIIKALNSVFNKIIEYKGIFHPKGLPEIKTDFGADKIRRPIARAIKKRPDIKNIIAGLKFTKIALATLAGVYISGVVVPKFYQNLTAKILKKEKEEKYLNLKNSKVNMNDFLAKTSSDNNGKNIAFGNMASKICTAAHVLEKNPIANLLSVDVGLLAGRAYNSRNNDERFEFIFRDVSSSCFYMGSTPLVYKLLSKYADRFKGKNTDLNPNTVSFVTNFIQRKLKDKNYSPEEFEKLFWGNDEELVTKFISKINTETLGMKRFKKIINSIVTDKDKAAKILANAQTFIDLRPKSATTVLTQSEMINAVQGGLGNDAKFLTRAVNVATEFTSQNPTKFVSFQEIDKIKVNIRKYIESIVEYAQKSGQNIINKDILIQAKNRNAIMKSVYTMCGLCISGLFLSTVIPKIQYKLTEMRTGNKEFPGIRDIK